MQNTKEQMKEAKSINLSLHYLEQVIVSLRDNMRPNNASNEINSNKQQQQQQSNQLHNNGTPSMGVSRKSSSNHITSEASKVTQRPQSLRDKDKDKDAFVPYRNSVLTSMLRDSLGGNCRSSFLLTISRERLHFEESVATCRFGQRCGEIKVNVKANTEIGLTDQLRDLQQRLKMFEKKFAVNEERRRALEDELLQESELRRQQTELRTLSDSEKAQCKACVQELLAAARESLSTSQENIGSTDEEREQQRERERQSSEMLIEQSQDALYNVVEYMDKALLVELSTALGGLVQSMYIERELTKREEAIRETRRQQVLLEERERQEHDTLIQSRFTQGNSSKHNNSTTTSPTTRRSDDQLPWPLPNNIANLLLRGRLFFKHNRYGNPKLRHYSMHQDWQHLQWHDVASGSSANHTENVSLSAVNK
jgi:hypothetical protein